MQWMNFGILLFILYHILFKPLLKFLDKRSQTIAGNIEEAIRCKEKSLEVLNEYNDKQKAIRSEADKVFQEARRRAEDEKAKIMESAHVESRSIVNSAKNEIERETKKAREQLKSDISSLVVDCASKVLEREVNEQDNKKIIQEFLKQ